MKSRFALLAMMVVAAAPLAAQGGGGGGGGMRGGRGGMTAEQYETTYKLTADQKAKFEPVFKAYNDHVTSLRNYRMAQGQAGAEVSPDSTKLQMDLQTKFNADFKAILTADQVKIFDSVQAARGQGRRGGGGGK